MSATLLAVGDIGPLRDDAEVLFDPRGRVRSGRARTPRQHQHVRGGIAHHEDIDALVARAATRHCCYPVLRRPAAMPFIVTSSARSSVSSAFPLRDRRSSSTCTRLIGST